MRYFSSTAVDRTKTKRLMACLFARCPSVRLSVCLSKCAADHMYVWAVYAMMTREYSRHLNCDNKVPRIKNDAHTVVYADNDNRLSYYTRYTFSRCISCHYIFAPQQHVKCGYTVSKSTDAFCLSKSSFFSYSFRLHQRKNFYCSYPVNLQFYLIYTAVANKTRGMCVNQLLCTHLIPLSTTS